MEIPAWGAILALVISIVLILRKFIPAYALIAGAFIGGLLSSGDIVGVVREMTEGVKDLSPAVLRILTAGVLAGVLIKTRAANRIAVTIIKKLGPSNALLSLIIATFILTMVGVFIDVAVLTTAPIALEIARKSGIGRMTLLLALIGGGKSGNIVSPNPNTISAAANYNAPLMDVMYINIPSAIVGVIATLLIVKLLPFKEEPISADIEEQEDLAGLPGFSASVAGPVFTIFLLMLRPICGINIDPMIALPAGGLVCAIATRNFKNFSEYSKFGLEKIGGVAILLVSTGTLAGIIKVSTLKNSILDFMSYAGISDIFIAPVSGAFMSGATASTTAGATIASASFSGAVIAAGISAVWGAALTNVGATVFDHLPHGSFFHVTGGSVDMGFYKRLRLVPYESFIAGVMTGTSTLICHLSMLYFS